MKRLIAIVGIFVLASLMATPLTAEWSTSDGKKFATLDEATAHAQEIMLARLGGGPANKLESDDGQDGERADNKLPIGDQVTLTVVYGDDARSDALKRAFHLNPLAPVRKQMRYEAYEHGGDGDWAVWASKRELPALIVQYNGEEVLIRSGREITDYHKLADELSMSYSECFHGRRGGHNPPPPDTGDDTPPPLPPVTDTKPPIADNSSVSVGPNGVAVTLGAFGAGCLVALVVGFVRRARGAD